MGRRGMPSIKPALDLQDRQALSAAGAWQFDRIQLRNAAQRYGAQQWLVIRFYRTSAGQWRGSSWLDHRGKTDLQNLNAPTLNGLIGQAVDRAVDRISSRYVFVPQKNADSFLLTLENIRSYESYKKATGYLESLELVRAVQVISADGDQLRLALEMDGDAQILLAALRRDRRLSEITSTLPAASTPVVEEYRFRWGR